MVVLESVVQASGDPNAEAALRFLDTLIARGFQARRKVLNQRKALKQLNNRCAINVHLVEKAEQRGVMGAWNLGKQMESFQQALIADKASAIALNVLDKDDELIGAPIQGRGR